MKKVINTIFLWASTLSSLLPITAYASGVVYDKALYQQVIKQTPQAVQLYKNLLSLPNDTHNQEDIKKLSSWLIHAFNQRGFESHTLDMSGSPLVYAERINPNAKKTVLVYLQADGQPVDPKAWQQPNPYQAVLKKQQNDGRWQVVPWSYLTQSMDPDLRIFARSAADSKGPIAQFLVALDLIQQQGPLNYNLKVIMDTEEEIGSPNLPAAIIRHKQKLKADMLLIFDGPPHYSNQPTVTLGARGIATVQLTTYGPYKPQHSGHYGNYAPNPALHLSQILGSMKSQDGRVLIPNFYEGSTISADLRELLSKVPDDEQQLKQKLGFSVHDKVGNTLQESIQFPSLNIRGLQSGWVEQQARTIVPDKAIAEIDIRLVKESNPQRLISLIRNHIESLGYYVIDRVPTHKERMAHPYIVTMKSKPVYGAFRSEPNSLAGKMAIQGLTKFYGERPIVLRSGGGSIPIAPIIDTLKIPAAIVPSVNADNNQHSPNENLRVGNFIEGIAIIASVLNQPL
ncbi:M20/M25/M40 family metallo-hydrolase [Pseudoalteromonas luteoviolacea]|uniref:Peptidase M20 dimerisation domain-containing protein n=1 Tax=Pseudoalteromonas luteoviolacea H33 TaxID=1365251 RepID=A0A167F6K1_9GAMM|nr:M20/M25/M40 family metallo-hydrolase [Pseudoalteromonas luteoviolacea]KZN51759.1 hypothetical protein N476_12000 [Pseudoalteromonas luteoviolacea H33]KZN72764.1 hypothetical protein N477_24540 [Pseudoalteromonas luteoviolacea H33-S]